jgi:hypothetical protein
MKNFFNLHMVLKIIGQNKNSQNAQQFLESGFFQSTKNYGQ